MNGEAIDRVLRVELKDFRGFKVRSGGEPHVVDTDADLVLLSGANGHGKTSFLEAILLLLTGWYDVDSDPQGDEKTYVRRALVSHYKRNEREVIPADDLTLCAQVRAGQTAVSTVKLTWKSNAEGIPPMPKLPQRSRLLPDETEEPSLAARELDARLTGFFQGRVDRLFDQAATGRTFRDVFDPLPPLVASFDDKTLWEGWRSRVRQAREEALFRDALAPSPVERRKRLSDEWRTFRPLFIELAEVLGWKDESPEAVGDERLLDDFARQLVGVQSTGETLRRDFVRYIERYLEDAIRRASSEAGQDEEQVREIQAELDERRTRQAKLQERFPNLDQELSWIESEQNLPNALDIFLALERHAERWAELPHETLVRVRDEFSKVSAVDAGKCANMLADFLEPRREVRQALDTLNAEVQAFEQRLRQARRSEKLTQLQKLRQRFRGPLRMLEDVWEQCHEARRHEAEKDARGRALRMLDELERALDGLEEVIRELTSADEQVLDHLRERVQAVMERFSMVNGCLPIRLEPSQESGEGASGRRVAHIVLDDGRRLEHLSSGQKAQTALALMVAQNQAAAEYLAHRVILLDDITTDYDLSNLSRQALLVRQLVYGNSDPMDRRQVFMSSHHEDMTNQILDMLVPPHGRSMKMLRFQDWSTETGPEYDLLEVEPSAEVNVAQLQEDLGDF